MSKQYDREEFQRQNKHLRKRQKIANNLLSKYFYKDLIKYQSQQNQINEQQKSVDKTIIKEFEKNQNKLKKNYIYYKEQYNYERDSSLGQYNIERIIEVGQQQKHDKIRIKQKVLKGKEFDDSFIY